jgi:hypothetical protein
LAVAIVPGLHLGQLDTDERRTNGSAVHFGRRVSDGREWNPSIVKDCRQVGRIVIVRLPTVNARPVSANAGYDLPSGEFVRRLLSPTEELNSVTKENATHMIRIGVSSCALMLLLGSSPTYGQEPPPRIGPFVVDFHGTFPKFAADDLIAASRGLAEAELSGLGIGMSGGAHFYFLKVSGVTIGVGGEATVGRSHASPTAQARESLRLRAVTETFKSASPQLSLNFGNGNGWSYLSIGLGRSKWSIVPDGAEPLPADEETLRTINYGGGARWFAKPRLAFSLDVRFYELKPGSPQGALPATPHAVMFVIGAGISVR